MKSISSNHYSLIGSNGDNQGKKNGEFQESFEIEYSFNKRTELDLLLQFNGIALFP